MIDRPGTTAKAGALLRQMISMPLAKAIEFAQQTDDETFRPPVEVSNAEARWWDLCDMGFARYRSAATQPGERCALAVERALVGRLHAPDVTDLDDTIDAATASLCPRWPSGIEAVNEACGGAYGTEVIGGQPGAGKSLLALDQAMRAAAKGWRVVYFDTELSVPNLRGRLDAIRLNRPGVYDLAMREPRQIHFGGLDTLRGGFEGLCGFITNRIMPSDDRVLVVLDHVHDVVRGLTRGSTKANAFFRALESIADAAKTSRRETEGHVAWILVAELNQHGGIRGGQLDYAADMVLALRKEEDEKDVTELRVEKGREGGEGNYGKFYRDKSRGCLTPVTPQSQSERQAEWMEAELARQQKRTEEAMRRRGLI